MGEQVRASAALGNGGSVKQRGIFEKHPGLAFGGSATSINSERSGGKKLGPRALRLSFTANGNSMCLRAKNCPRTSGSHPANSANFWTTHSLIPKRTNRLTRRASLRLAD